ncbi:MAG: autotransporter outer membrane beta-barrel domain-containing protein, partial [Elusimicrobiota bacterium]|nr:autotransporter outer membrane beta-barrel domain-containing protein [Elusimicrobiota bacterium]
NVKFNINAISNSSNASGGFLTIDAEFLTFSSAAVFKNNTAATNGGALYLTNSASVTFNAVNDDVLFIGNKADNKNNDIHINDTDSSLTLAASAGKTIIMNGGITGNGSVNKTGAGDLIFQNAAIIDYQGKFNIEQGAIIISAQSANISSITMSADAKLSLQNGAINRLNIDKGYISGSLELDLNFYLKAGDYIYASDTIEIVSGSSFTINLLDERGITGRKIAIINANSLIYTGGDFWGYDKSLYDIYKEDNTIIVKLIGQLASPQPLNNNFLANALTLGANNTISDTLYERMGDYDNEKAVWFGFYGNGKNLGDFSSSESGAVIGMDFYTKAAIMAGVYVRYGANSAKQDSDNAAMSDIEFGLYGKTQLSNQFNLKGNLSGAIQTYSAKKPQPMILISIRQA